MNALFAFLICILLGNVLGDCGFKNPHEAQIISLVPKEGSTKTFEIEAIQNVTVTSSELYIKVDISDDRKTLLISLKNMRKLHWSLESNSSPKRISYDLQLICDDNQFITVDNLVIHFSRDNIYKPEMVAVETWAGAEVVPIKRYKLPMPFPPNVDITVINKLTVRDLDMYNEGIRLEWDNKDLNYEVHVVKGLKGKYFDIWLKANIWLNESRYADTLYIFDKPFNSEAVPKFLMVDVIIKKDLTL